MHERTPAWSRVRRLLVVRLDNLGDVIMTGPALRAIKAALPHVHLTLLASPGGAPAAELLPWIDAVLVCRALWQDLGRLLRRDTACTPCYRMTCPFGQECLALASEEVAAAGLELLAETRVAE